MRKFSRLPVKEQAIFAAAVALLGVARLLLWVQPFRRLARCLGGLCRHCGFSHLLSRKQRRRAKKIGRLVRQAARHTPWESKCLVQAVAAKILLAACRIPSTVYLGVATGDAQGMQAHAWVTAGPVHVTGGDGARDFTIIAVFTSGEGTLNRARQSAPVQAAW